MINEEFLLRARSFFVSFFFFLTGLNLSTQNEIKLYAGLMTDFPGIAFEHYFSNQLSLEIGTSNFLNHSYTENWNGNDVKNRNASNYLNLRLKKN